MRGGRDLRDMSVARWIPILAFLASCGGDDCPTGEPPTGALLDRYRAVERCLEVPPGTPKRIALRPVVTNQESGRSGVPCDDSAFDGDGVCGGVCDTSCGVAVLPDDGKQAAWRHEAVHWITGLGNEAHLNGPSPDQRFCCQRENATSDCWKGET